MSTLVLYGGKFRNADGIMDAEAIAISGDTISAVGTLEEVRRSAAQPTSEVDLAGATVIPGLIDPHNHMLATGQMLGEVSLYDTRSIAELQDRLRSAVSNASEGQWLSGRGWDESLFAEQRLPNRHDLDAVAPVNPVVLQRVWNKLVVNTKALEELGIDASTPDPPETIDYAGSFDRESDGYPTGIFRDRAKEMVLFGMPQPSQDQLVANLKRASQAYNAVGLTTVVDPGLRPHQIDGYFQAERDDMLTVRSELLMSGWGFVPAAEEPELEDRIRGMKERWPTRRGIARIAGVKLLPDGGVGDRTARLYEHYLDEPENVGVWAIPREDLPRRIRWVHDQGWSLDIHVCGDESQDVSVQGLASAMEANPNPSLRHRVHHAYFPTASSLGLMAKHKISAVTSPPFIRSLGEGYVLAIGEERAGNIMPYRDYLNHGVPLAGSSDSTVADFNPWVGMASALDRKTLTGRLLGGDQVLHHHELLGLYTSSAAFAIGRETDLGDIAPEYLADLVVLEHDVFEPGTSADTIANTRPLRVMFGGEWVV